MDMQADFRIEADILKVVGQGNFTLASNKEVFEEIIKKCQQKNLSKAILDLRDVNGQCLKFESYDLVNHVTSLLKEVNNSSNNNISIAFCAYGNLLEDTSYVNQIAENQKVAFKAMSEYDSAMSWIASA